MSDHYVTLGIARDAGTDAIVRAWREAASRFHPDRVQGDAEKKEAAAKFASARAAFNCLMDRQERAEHDRQLSGALADPGAISSADYASVATGELIVPGAQLCPICLGKKEVRVSQDGFWLRKPCPACS